MPRIRKASAGKATPAPAAPAAPAALVAAPRTRTPASDEVKAKIKRTRGENSAINRYLMRQENGPTKARNRTLGKIEEIEERLASGTKTQKTAVWEEVDGVKQRTGSRDTEVALTPTAKFEMRRKLAEHKSRLGADTKSDELRTLALSVLPAYAERNGASSADLILMGFTQEELDIAFSPADSE